MQGVNFPLKVGLILHVILATTNIVYKETHQNVETAIR